MTRERLFIFDTTLRDGAQTQGVDFSVEDKRQIALALDTSGRGLHRRRLAGRQSHRHGLLCRTSGPETCPLHRLRHDQAGRAQRRQRSVAGAGAGCALSMPSAWWARPAPIRSRWRWKFRWKRISTISPAPWKPFSAKSASRCSMPSISSTATRPIPTMPCPASRPPMRRAPDGSCCATPMAAPCRKRPIAIVSDVKDQAARRARWASMPITTPNKRWRCRWPRSAPARARSRARSNGLGERCGNANLCSLLPNLMLKEPFASQFETGVSLENLKQLTHVSRLAGRDPEPRAQPLCALCRRVGLHPQGRPACLGGDEESRDL